MATQQTPSFISLLAGSDLSAKQFYFMDVSAGKLAVASVGGRVVGVLCDKPASSTAPGRLQFAGVAKVLAGGSITSGASVAADASGKAVAATGSAYVCGVSVSSGTVSSGEHCEVLLAGSAGVGLAAAIETKTSGALTPAIPTTYMSVTGTVAFTLADGTYTGQTKRMECTVAASSPAGTLTIATPAGAEPATHVFHAVGQVLELLWNGTGWHCIGVRRAGSLATVVGTTVLTGYDLAYDYALSVTGTVSSTSTMAIPNGNVPGERIHINTPTAATIPSGSIAITAITIATNAAATSLAGLNATTCQASFEWNGAAWQNTALTTATLS